MKTSAQRQCAREGCRRWFADPHDGDWPRGLCSPECHAASKPAKAPSRPRTPLPRSKGGERPRRAVSAASAAQRAKRGACIVTGATEGVDAAHLVSRAMGGCDHPDCTVSLRRDLHRELDAHRLDILPDLLAHGLVAELQHALGHMRGDLVGLLERLTGERWAPIQDERRAA